jgi:hypothetical protein
MKLQSNSSLTTTSMISKEEITPLLEISMAESAHDNKTLRIVPVVAEKDMEDFLRLPWRIYRDNPNWVPPVIAYQKNFLDPRTGPFFEFGEAQYFLAYLEGQPAGRISAHINRLHNQYHDAEDGFFGFFECVPDVGVASALFNAATDWLRQRGKSRLIGPLNFCIYDEMGLLVNGFDTMPALFQTYTPPYYLDLLTELGFSKVLDYYAMKINQRDIDVPRLEKRLQQILKGQGFTFTSYRPEDLKRRAQEVYELFNEAWHRNWSHVPLTDRQYKRFFHELQPLLRPELSNLIFDGDKLVAFNIAIPDINPFIQKLNGRLTWLDRIRLWYEAKYQPLKKARGLVLGVLQPYQNRRLHHALIIRTYINIVKNTPCEVCDLSLIPENLGPYIKALEFYGARHYKTFRVLQRNF